MRVRRHNGSLQSRVSSANAEPFALACAGAEIGGMAFLPDESRTLPRAVTLVLSSAVGLTLLFTAQDVIRRSASGAPVNWAHSFALNALDWVVWATLVPFVIAIGRHIRLGAGSSLASRLPAWLALGVAYVAVQSTMTGLVIRYVGFQFFGMAGPGPGPAARPLASFLWSWGLGTSSLNLLIFGMTTGCASRDAFVSRPSPAPTPRGRSESAARARGAQLLRTQLQPHFLFNALHTVSSLMVSDVAAAQACRLRARRLAPRIARPHGAAGDPAAR